MKMSISISQHLQPVLRTLELSSVLALLFLPSLLLRTFFYKVQPKVLFESLCMAYPTLSVAYAETGIPKDEF